MNFYMSGRLTKDVENTSNGVYRVAVACNRVSKGEKKADFFTLTAFGKTGENISKYFHKGDGILVSGVIHNDNYTNKDGKTVYGSSYVINTWEFPPTSSSTSGKSGTSDEDPDTVSGFMDMPETEDLPFN